MAIAPSARLTGKYSLALSVTAQHRQSKTAGPEERVEDAGEFSPGVGRSVQKGRRWETRADRNPQVAVTPPAGGRGRHPYEAPALLQIYARRVALPLTALFQTE
ncbi:hypothetical protein EYF80_063324 [Liparis tanakae]|uniref:Uncharacterized protein n=1 Tax=Liparis tanakae TaxID=230148 RepID=A0A4Z2ED97_9TELE|nr:hypothetical protein EYF80_063324 [Liparis tanakae]